MDRLDTNGAMGGTDEILSCVLSVLGIVAAQGLLVATFWLAGLSGAMPR